MSDTPRTDSAMLKKQSFVDVDADFARELERENARLREALKDVINDFVSLLDSDYKTKSNNCPWLDYKSLTRASNLFEETK